MSELLEIQKTKAIKHQQKGELAEALAILETLASTYPNDLTIQYLYGLNLSQLGRFREALPYLHQAVNATQDLPEPHNALGICLEACGFDSAAEKSFLQSISISPTPYAYNQLGNLYLRLRKTEEAIATFIELSEKFNQFTPGLVNLSRAYIYADQPIKAITVLKKIIRREGPKKESLFNLALAHKKAGRYRPSLALIEQYQTQFETTIEVLSNKGEILAALGRFEDALNCYDACLEKNPDHAVIQLNRALLMLLVTNGQTGWQGYSYRKFFGERVAAVQNIPSWNGEPISGELLINGEQGIGDEIMFSSLLIKAKEICTQITLYCEPRLHAIFSRSFSTCNILKEADPSIDTKNFSYQTSLGDLPAFLYTDFREHQTHQPYLVPDPSRIKHWKNFFSDKKINIGISWRGGHSFEHRVNRSTELYELAPILEFAGARFIPLQYDASAAELIRGSVHCDNWVMLPKHLDPKNNIDDLAALVASLDLIITVDNSLAHLAGACGAPVWILLASVPDWRWGLTSESTGWYPNARLFRQLGSQHGWKDVVLRIKSELAGLSNTRVNRRKQRKAE